jgi:ATP-binding cassette subfamily C protein CydCD
LAWVPQRPALFPGTVADNIRIARPDADRARLERAAAHAGLGPRSWTVDSGRTGSASRPASGNGWRCPGAFLRDPAIVLLDEATKSVVVPALRELMAGRTTVLVTHRPAVLALADRVVVLEPAIDDAVGPDVTIGRAMSGATR